MIGGDGDGVILRKRERRVCARVVRICVSANRRNERKRASERERESEGREGERGRGIARWQKGEGRRTRFVVIKYIICICKCICIHPCKDVCQCVRTESTKSLVIYEVKGEEEEESKRTIEKNL